MNRIVKTVSTRAFVGDDAVSTELTIDLSNLTEADRDEYAVQTLIIRRQSAWRKMKAIPTVDTYIAPKPGTRGTGAITRAALLTKLLGDKFDAVIQKYGGVDEAYTALKSFFDDETDDIN